ncbi:MAG: 6-carboxytetrahydropterin synthase [Bacteroidetes bacterium]|nr:6-carboxytetrahydropterin synthase [Bacteroidota bacterium]
MAKIRITKQFNFEMAHVLKDYDGPCRNIHGHSYELFVTLAGEPNSDPASPKFGMIMDYKDLKDLVKRNITDELDHALLISDKYEPEKIDFLRASFEKVIVLPYQPTSENIILDIANRIKLLLPPRIILHSLKLRETATAYAEWFADDNPL